MRLAKPAPAAGALFLAPFALLAACARSDAPDAAPSAAAPAAITSAAASSSAADSGRPPGPTPPSVTALREGDRSSSALALAEAAGKKVALLADADDARLRVLDLDDGHELASAKLVGTPGHVVLDDAGRAWVAVRDASVVQAFTLDCSREDAGACSLSPGPRVAAASDPIALAVKGPLLIVVSGWGREVATYSIDSGRTIARAPVGPEPRALLVGEDGRTLVVAHAAGSILTTLALGADGRLVVTRESRLDYRDQVYEEGTNHPAFDEPRFAGQGFALARVGGRVLAPMAAAYPGDPEPSPTYGPARGDAFFPHETAVFTIDDPAGDAMPWLRARAAVVPVQKPRISGGRVAWPKEAPPCVLPRAAVPRPDGSSILVACLGINAVVEIDAENKPLVESMKERWSVPAGPVALAVDKAARAVWVWSEIDRALTKLSGPSFAIAREVARDPSWLRGRAAFHSSIAFDGRACASCHPDGRTDGLTWASPNGALQTPMLAGRLADPAPFGWLGDAPTLEAHLKQTLTRLRARAVDADESAGLLKYIRELPAPRAGSARTATEERGRAIFDSSAAGCSTCHTDSGRGSDGSRRDVGTGGQFDTPSLRFIGGTGPYMHDGRYSTLRAALAATDGRMGSTKNLSESDVSALIAYLRSIGERLD